MCTLDQVFNSQFDGLDGPGQQFDKVFEKQTIFTLTRLSTASLRAWTGRASNLTKYLRNRLSLPWRDCQQPVWRLGWDGPTIWQRIWETDYTLTRLSTASLTAWTGRANNLTKWETDYVYLDKVVNSQFDGLDGPSQIWHGVSIFCLLV